MKKLETPSSPRRLMGLVSCDLFLELIDPSLEGVHFELAERPAVPSARSDKQHAIHVVRFHDIRDETAVQHNSLDARTDGQVEHPAHGLHLHATKFGLTPETGLDLLKGRRMNARRKPAGIVKGRDQVMFLLAVSSECSVQPVASRDSHHPTPIHGVGGRLGGSAMTRVSWVAWVAVATHATLCRNYHSPSHLGPPVP